MTRATLTRYLRGVLAAPLLLSLACQTDVDDQLALAGLSEECQLNSDCQKSLVCVFQLCHAECASSRDCKGGARCVAGAAKRNACQLPNEQSCAATGACPGSQACGVDAQCRDACQSSAECLGEQVCAGGTCAEPGELDEDGRLPQSDERPAWLPEPCAYDSDCADSQRCGEGGSCRARCALDADCLAGQSCQEGACRADAAPECRYDSSCGDDARCVRGSCEKVAQPPTPECNVDPDCTTAGQHCDGGRCRCECATPSDCARGQTCANACQCVPDLIVHGNVTVSNMAQFAELQNVVEITGQLALELSGDLSQTELHLPHLTRVNGITATGIHGDSFRVVFDALTTASGLVKCDAFCRFPVLQEAGELDLAGSGVLSLPALTGATRLKVSGPSLVALDLPVLSELEIFEVVSTGLPSVALPFVSALKELKLDSNQQLVSVDFAKTELTRQLKVSSNPALQELELRGLAAALDPKTKAPIPLNLVSVTSNEVLGKLILPNLDQVTLLQLSNLLQLTTVDLDGLTDAGINVSNGNKTLKLSLPALTTGNISVDTALGALSVPALTTSSMGITVTQSGLTELTLPGSLTTIPNLYVEHNSELTKLVMNGLGNANFLTINDAPKLTTLEAKALAEVSVALVISFTGLTELYSLDPDADGSLALAGGVSITDNPALPSCRVTELDTHVNAHSSVPIQFDNQRNLDAPGACP